MSDIKTKKCSTCGEVKPLTEFHKDKQKKDGVRSHCKSCRNNYYQENKEAIKEYYKTYYQDNKEGIIEQKKKYRQDNKEAIKERKKRYRQENKEAIREQNKKYYQENKEYYKKYYQDNKEGIIEQKKKYRQDNKEAIKERKKRYRQENKEAIREWHNKYMKERYANDPEYRTSCQLRKQTRRLGDYKNTTTLELVGCSPYEFWQMNGSPSIEELKDLHIDHIIPLSWFNLDDPDHVKVCNHYLNLQYLSSEDNLKKGARYMGSPDKILAYQEGFDIDAHVSEMLVIIDELN